MRVRRFAPVLAILLLAACDGGDPRPPAPTDTPPGGPPAPAPPPNALNSSGVVVAKSETSRPGEAWIPDGGLPPFGQREKYRTERGSWLQQLEPDETEFCTFTERPASQRPKNLVVTAWSGNMDLWTEGYVLGHDHAIGFVEAMWMKRKPVIAARAGMLDLWIEPVGDFTNTILRIGPDELTCVRWEG